MFGPAAKYISVFLLSMVKFFGGPVAGAAIGLSFWDTLMLTVGGMMTSVIIFSFIGTAVSRRFAASRRLKNKKVFNKKSRRIVKVWMKFGMGGIAFMTPILLSPIIGTILATVLGAKRLQIILHMFWSAILWGTIFTYLIIHLQLIEHLKNLELPFVGK